MGACMGKTGLFLSPDVEVVTAEVRSVSLMGVELDVILSVNNPNPGSLPATRVCYIVKKASDNLLLSEGVSNHQFTIPANGNTKERIPIKFNWSGVGSTGKSLMMRGKSKVLISGDITFDAPMAPGGTATSKYTGEIEIVNE